MRSFFLNIGLIFFLVFFPLCNAMENFCFDCLGLNKLLSNTEFDENAVNKKGAKAPDILFADQLVFIPTKTNKWQAGLIVYPSCAPEDPLVHMLISHREGFFKRDLIRIFKARWQHELHPDAKIDWLQSTLDTFLTTFGCAEKRPFVQIYFMNLSDTVTAVGDLHGGLEALNRIIKSLYTRGFIDDDEQMNSGSHCVFTGDYTDRGKKGDQVWHMLMNLKLKNRRNVFLLRGNHEVYGMAKEGNFWDLWNRSYGCGKMLSDQQKEIARLFSSLPQALLLGIVNKIGRYRFLLFVHGGLDLSVNLKVLIEAAIARHKKDVKDSLTEHEIPLNNCESSGFLWSDFHANKDLHDEDLICISSRGADNLSYSALAVEQYARINQRDDTERGPYQIDAIIRGHQNMPDGVECLRRVVDDSGNEWRPLVNGRPELVERGSVYTCTSAPESFSGTCLNANFEFSYLQVRFNHEKDLWEVIPFVQR